MIENVKKSLLNFRDGNQIFLDYDGTLVPIVNDPENCYAPDELKQLLKILNDRYELYIVSGRTLEDLEKFLSMPLNFIYLHGLGAKVRGKDISLIDNIQTYTEKFQRVKNAILSDEFEGLRVYDKGFGVVFHLGLVPKKLHDEIIEKVEIAARENDLGLYYGKNLVEVKIMNINKGKAIRKLRNEKECMIAGDEETDEDAFRECRECISIHIGDGSSLAKFKLRDITEFRMILDYLAYRPRTS